MNRLRLTIGVSCALAMSAASGCASKIEIDTRFAENKSLFVAIGKADALTLYEGLPHQFHEPNALAQEQRDKQTVTLYGYPFYSQPLNVSTEDRDKLRGLLGTETSFFPWQGERKCGGFHPDYCAEWHADGQTYRVLICFGCSEIKIYGPSNSLRCDIKDESTRQVAELLKKYRKNRPPERAERR